MTDTTDERRLIAGGTSLDLVTCLVRLERLHESLAALRELAVERIANERDITRATNLRDGLDRLLMNTGKAYVADQTDGMGHETTELETLIISRFRDLAKLAADTQHFAATIANTLAAPYEAEE